MAVQAQLDEEESALKIERAAVPARASLDGPIASLLQQCTAPGAQTRILMIWRCRTMKRGKREVCSHARARGMVRQDEIRKAVLGVCACAGREIFERFAAARRHGCARSGTCGEKYGCNIVSGKRKTAVKRFLSAFIDPFTGILLALAVAPRLRILFLPRRAKAGVRDGL